VEKATVPSERPLEDVVDVVVETEVTVVTVREVTDVVMLVMERMVVHQESSHLHCEYPCYSSSHSVLIGLIAVVALDVAVAVVVPEVLLLLLLLNCTSARLYSTGISPKFFKVGSGSSASGREIVIAGVDKVGSRKLTLQNCQIANRALPNAVFLSM
jgi:hypothetical protein